MRLWSLHPHYLDSRGLTALWREALLAQAVVRGLTKGYKNHPQLTRFKNTPLPEAAVAAYLKGVLDEAVARSFSFDKTRIKPAPPFMEKIPVTKGQLEFERDHLEKKLMKRSPKDLARLARPILHHPIFLPVEGNVEEWEIF